ncbi:MAG: hypothetical protein KBD01_01465 [Acidobacteria bacterium]|nr:hypothetical protein [Acidobacteriota bacterium]
MARRLGEVLISEERLTPRQLEEALRTQRIFGGSLGTHLLQLGFVDEGTLGAALALMHGVPAVGRGHLSAAPARVVALLPADYARRHRAVPFRVEGDDLHLAMQNPADTLALHEAAFLTGFRVVPHVAPEAVIRDALALHYPTGTPAPVPPAVEPEAGETAPVSAPAPPTAAAETTARTAAGRGLGEAGRRLASALDRDAVLGVALDELAREFPRAAVFAVRGNEAVLWRARGLPTTAGGRPLAVSLEDGSVLAAAAGKGEISYGPVPATTANQDLYILFGGRVPRVALVVPVALRGRTVAILYADDPAGGALPPDFGRIRRLGLCVALALEAVILRGKILRES